MRWVGPAVTLGAAVTHPLSRLFTFFGKSSLHEIIRACERNGSETQNA
jgi:hypothetical protein